MMVDSRRGFDAAYLWETPDDGKRYEVIDGILYVTPTPPVLHQLALSHLLLCVMSHVVDRGAGKAIIGPIAVVLAEDTAVQPDLIFISADHLALISERGVEGAPDLIVEVISPETLDLDRAIKMRRYAAAGVPHYWIADPVRRDVEAYRLNVNRYERLGVFGAGSVFRPELFPGLEIPVDALWQ